MINGTYTHGKSLDDASSIGGGAQVIVQDFHNVPGQYGLSSFDIRHQLRMNYSYQLPFGDRQPYFTRGWKRKAFSDIRLFGQRHAAQRLAFHGAAGAIASGCAVRYFAGRGLGARQSIG